MAEAPPTKRAPKLPLGVDCVRAIPAPLIARHLLGMTPDYQAPFVPIAEENVVTTCRFVRGDQHTIEVVYYCGPDHEDVEQYLAEARDDDGRPITVARIPSIGRGAFRDEGVLAVQHRSLPCLIEVDGLPDPSQAQWTQLLEGLEASLGPALAPQE